MRNMNENGVALVLTCLEGDECTVAFEPEGATHVLKKDDLFHVEISGGTAGELEIGYAPNGITVVAWPNGITRVTNRAGAAVQT